MFFQLIDLSKKIISQKIDLLFLKSLGPSENKILKKSI